MMKYYHVTYVFYIIFKYWPTSVNKQGEMLAINIEQEYIIFDEDTAEIARQFIDELQKQIDKKIVVEGK